MLFEKPCINQPCTDVSFCKFLPWFRSRALTIGMVLLL
uniref:Uncharacterized protein n=1 Tax=Arundo donax TaxID=35708 RepID=A0A0A8YAD9_ARUDO